jgi:hypothetical protein
MSHRISVDFTGLCVFSTMNVPKRLSVLLATDPRGHMRHRPILSFNVRNHKFFQGKTMSEVIQLPDGRQIASWDLNGRIVSLRTGGSTRPKKVVLCGGGPPATRMPQNPRAELDLCWVPSLTRIAGSSELNSIYLEDKPVPRSGKSALAARVDIDRGHLFSNAAVNRLQPTEWWTIPTASGEPLRQYLADTVRLEIDVDSDALLEIDATRFGGRDTETLTLEPVDKKIELVITNLPDVLPSPAVQQKEMMHFGLYYELLDPIPRRKPIPTLSGASGRKSMPTHAHSMGMEGVATQGVHPVKCTPGIIP